MAKFKNFISTHKKMCIVICVLVVLAIIGACVGIFFAGKGKGGQASKDKTVYEDWDNLIADLEEEPVSENDEKYKDTDDVKDKSYKISINKTQNCIVIYGKDTDGKYTKVVKSMICSVGFDTPTGTFKTTDKYRWKIVNGNVWAQYATRVVGNVLIHSMPYQSNDKGTLIPNYYNQLGRTLSASCIRVSAGDSCWIMSNCKAGTIVEIFESEDVTLERPSAIKVPDDATWDPTDPDVNNPWRSVELEFKGLEDMINIERGNQFDYMQGVEITDTCGNDISSQVEVKTDMDVFTPGSYSAKYEVTDATGKTAEKNVIFNVQDTLAPKLSGLSDTLYFSSAASVTKESILDGVKVLDNNQVLSADNVQADIPVLVEGVNQVTLTVSDSYGNVMTTTINIMIDSNPPQVSLKAGMTKLIELDQIVDRAYAISRIEATDDGKNVEDSYISVSIIPQLWGYVLNYKVSDKQGNVTSFQDEVEYVGYQIIPSGKLNVTDVADKTQLLKGVELKSTSGKSISTDNISCKVTETENGKYEVTYSYTYSSPLGTKTVTANDKFEMKIPATASPSEKPDVSKEPVETELPSEKPDVSEEPKKSEEPEITYTPVP